MIERHDIAGYCRISVDEELDRDNVSIENQKAILSDFVKQHFPDSALTFYEDPPLRLHLRAAGKLSGCAKAS